MSFQFKNTLHYSSPAHGDWGVVRVGMLIPESYQLFICPFACGRHGAIGARKVGLNTRLSYLYVDQNDIISGYDDLIIKGVEDLFEILDETPKVLLIFVSCLDDFLATDHESFLRILSQEHPQVRFRVAHMNPISLGSKTPPPVSIQNTMYSLLEEKTVFDNSVNTIGNLVKISLDCELYNVLEGYGVNSLRHISDYEKFDDYQEMASSSLNLILSPTAKQAGDDLEKRLAISSLFFPITYYLDEIEENYKKLIQTLNRQGRFDFKTEKEKAEKAIEKALAVVKDLPIIIDASAVMQPFGLAQALLEYGFNVLRIEAQQCAGIDKDHFQWVTTTHPEVELHQPQHFDSILFNRTVENSLSIGINAAYLSNSRYIADLFADEGMFGYHGVCTLMELLIDAVKSPRDLEKIINEYGLVV